MRLKERTPATGSDAIGTKIDLHSAGFTSKYRYTEVVSDTPNKAILNSTRSYTDSNGLVRFQKVAGVTDMENDYLCVAAPGELGRCAQRDADHPSQMPKLNEPHKGAMCDTINAGYTTQYIFTDAKGKEFAVDVIFADYKKQPPVDKTGNFVLADESTYTYNEHPSPVEFIADVPDVRGASLPANKITTAGNVDLDKFVSNLSGEQVSGVKFKNAKIYEDGALVQGNTIGSGWKTTDDQKQLTPT